MIAIATDDFNRADETPISPPWFNHDINIIKIVSNVAVPSLPGSNAAAAYAGLNWPTDQYSQAELTTVGGTSGSGSGMGLRVRYQWPLDTAYELVVNTGASDNVNIYKWVNGGASQMGFRTTVIANGETIRLEVIGRNPTILRVYKNGTQVGADYTDSDNPIVFGNPGLAHSSTVTSSFADNWEGGGEYTAGYLRPNILRPRAFAPGLAR